MSLCNEFDRVVWQSSYVVSLAPLYLTSIITITM